MDNIQYVEKSIKDYECFKKELKNKKEENEELISVSMPAAFDKAVQTWIFGKYLDEVSATGTS